MDDTNQNRINAYSVMKDDIFSSIQNKYKTILDEYDNTINSARIAQIELNNKRKIEARLAEDAELIAKRLAEDKKEKYEQMKLYDFQRIQYQAEYRKNMVLMYDEMITTLCDKLHEKKCLSADNFYVILHCMTNKDMTHKTFNKGSDKATLLNMCRVDVLSHLSLTYNIKWELIEEKVLELIKDTCESIKDENTPLK